MYYFKRAAALIMAFALSVSTAVAVTACNFSSKKNGDKSTDAASHSSWQSDQSVGGQSGGQSADHSVGQSTAYSQGGGQSAGQSTSASQSAGQSAWQSTSASQSGGQSAEQSTSASQSAGQSAGQSTSTSQSTSDGGATVVDNDALISYAGVSESAYVIWSDDTAANAKAYYKKSDEDVYTQADDRLIREAGQGRARVDYPGLAAGEYDFKIDVGSSDKDIVVEKVLVTAYDRSGYAHFGYTAGVGAYNDDGTLKDGAVVVYVDENN
ncbi:MAG: hypothetical protein ILP02_00125, partial [Clostridia bacterium]|nr:hypothetical protein [Clostridia bacterium]